MMDGRFHSDLRASIDESADEIGAATVDDLPATEAEVRSALPDDLAELLAGDDDRRSLWTILSESPIARCFERPRQ
mgnify:CR=1 FL=1